MNEADQPVKNTKSEADQNQVDSRVSSVPDADLTMNSSAAAVLSAAERAKEPQTIGPYKLIRRLGEGGMGQVWLAEQSEPVKRQVALKLIRVGMYDSALLQRFYAERQSLAMMNHPAIAKVFDAGATPDGQPYFVMEYVQGVPISGYCDRKRVTVKQRLELFVKVCEGVQHAHQKAMIHRDLKPANILVTEVDGKAVPRIIDFGLAKATGPQMGDETMMTRAGGWVGTPGYMSPEQASGTGDVDTRTDVYSLGVVLYLLLTGGQPFDTSKWEKSPFYEVVRQLREVDPPRPSTKIGRDESSSRSIAELRRVQSQQLQKLLHGDLDWITLKALEKDRARRYGTPMELAADIGRYLNDEPVLAVPPSFAYRAAKFARRYRVALATACAFALVLIAASIVNIRQSIRANREAAVAQAVNDFLQNDLLGQASAYNQSKPDPDIKVRAVLDRSAQRIEGKFPKQPEVEAGIRATIGQTYQKLGQYPEARTQLERALELYRRSLGVKDPKTLKTMDRLGYLLELQGKYPEAEALLSQTVETQRRVLGPEHPDTLTSMGDLALIYKHEGKYAQAEALLSQAVEIQRRVLGPEHLETLWSMNNLALIYYDEGKYAQSEALHSQTLEIRRRLLGPEHPYTLGEVNNLALVYHAEGKYAQAEALYSQTVEIQRRVLGPEHPETLGSMYNLASVYDSEGKYAQAEALYSQTVEIRRRVLGPEHPDALWSMDDLASVYDHEGKYRQAEALYSQLLEIERRVLGAEHPDTLASMNSLANVYTHEGKYAQAEVLDSQILEIRHRVLGPEHPDTLASMNSLVNVYTHEGKYAQTEALYRKFLETRADDPLLLNGLAWYLVTVPNPGHRHPQEALDLARRAVKAAPDNAGCYNTLGLAEYRNGLWDDAITTLTKSAKLDKGTEPTDFFFLSMAYWERGDKAEAARFFQQGVDLASKSTSVSAELRMFWTEAAHLLGKPGPKAAAQAPR